MRFYQKHINRILETPRGQLILTLEYQLYRQFQAMESEFPDFSCLHISPPPSPKRASAAPVKRRPPQAKRDHGVALPNQHVPSKFINVPPEPLYYFEDGLRRVPPYHYTYNTYCKERWRGKTLLEIFTSEFRDRPEEYYRKAIATGAVCISGTDKTGQVVSSNSSIDTIVRNGDMISHTLHRHEPPVTGKPIETVYEDDDMIAISKPPGVPVHPAGRYNYNSVVEIMRYERKGLNPLPCNRLDRLTSGLMFIAKNGKSADDFMNMLRTRTIKKQYIARVKGEFPDGDIMCEEPILAISPKLGLNRVRANGKPAKTMFRKMKYNAAKDYSIVACHPLTGRTHQIRVHLQFLGHPICNDPIYCNRRVWGPNLGKGGEGDDEDIITRLSKMGKEEVADAIAYYDDMVDEYNRKKAELMTGEVCEDCGTELYSDPGVHELGIYLHAKRYECEEGKWAYETNMPDWALEDE
ncbi:DRAP deaminase [Rhizina undulata]